MKYVSRPVGPATAGTIKLVTITGGDDGIPPDLLLQSETHISAKTNARFETAKPNKADFVVEEGKKVNLATPVSVESESKMEVQTTESVAETVMPVQKVNRSVEVNVKRPSWLPEDWKFETKVCTNGASAGAVDNVFQKQSLHFSGCRDKASSWRRLATVDRLSQVGMHVPMDCIYCNADVESFDHLYMTILLLKNYEIGCCYNREFRRILATGKQSWIGTTFGDKRRLVEEQLLAVSLQWLYHSSRAKEMESGDRVCKEVVLHMHIRRKDLPKWKDALQMLNQIP
ncbi:hypothetical protein FXO38_36249 [Capsicum annuum]|nr:hypothetical protein FXO38_36249 [Capsicum annuum]